MDSLLSQTKVDKIIYATFQRKSYPEQVICIIEKLILINKIKLETVKETSIRQTELWTEKGRNIDKIWKPRADFIKIGCRVEGSMRNWDLSWA